MGQVFTWNAVRKGAIPRIEDFTTIAAYMRTRLAEEPAIESALLFGSVVRGDFDIRSDIDCVVLYNTAQEDAAMRLMQEIDRTACMSYVPINFTPCDTTIASTRLHHLGSSFIRHLQASIDAGGLVKGDLLSHLAPTVSVNEEIESYIKIKMYNMMESFAQSASFTAERSASFYKKMLEASTHVARKMLIYEGTLEGDSKKQVRKRYAETMPLEMSNLFSLLLNADARYTEEVERQSVTPNETRYPEALNELHKQVPVLIQFLRLNIVRLNEAPT